MNRKKKKGIDFVQRTCAGCREKRAKGDMVRIVLYKDKLTVDVSGKADGRGVYVCKNRDCMEALKKNNGIKRSFKMNFTDAELSPVYAELEDLL